MYYSSRIYLVGLSALYAIIACSASSSSDYGWGSSDSGPDGLYVPSDAPPNSQCKSEGDQDEDGDGYTVNQGDCNDCNPAVNPGAFDVPGNGIDDDCNGAADDQAVRCDMGLLVADNDPYNAARAMELCRNSTWEAQGGDKTWGVLAAGYTKADGAPGMADISHGLLPSFGVNPTRAGSAMLALSSGAARDPSQVGYENPSGYDTGTKGSPPEGYPKESQACPGVKTGSCNNPAALELEIRVPTNANSFSFDFNFFTYEFPNWICSEYNDFFVTLLWPKAAGLPDSNISFDGLGNSISVNASFLQVCDAQSAGSFGQMQKWYDCLLGSGALQGTGFGKDSASSSNHAATGWLITRTSVDPGSVIKLRFAIWDSGDTQLDSTVLIDNFQWYIDGYEDTVTTPIL